MKKMHLPSRMLSLLLAFALLLGFAAPARAADESTGVSFQRVDNSMVSGSLLCEAGVRRHGYGSRIHFFEQKINFRDGLFHHGHCTERLCHVLPGQPENGAAEADRLH